MIPAWCLMKIQLTVMQAEREERRRLENLVQSLKKEQPSVSGKPGSTSSVTAMG